MFIDLHIYTHVCFMLASLWMRWSRTVGNAGTIALTVNINNINITININSNINISITITININM